MKLCVFWSSDTQDLKTTVVLERSEESSLGLGTFQTQTGRLSPPWLFFQFDWHRVPCSRAWRVAHAYLATPNKSRGGGGQAEERGSLQTLGSLPRLCQDRGVSTDPSQGWARESPAPRGPSCGSPAPGRGYRATTAGPALDWTRGQKCKRTEGSLKKAGCVQKRDSRIWWRVRDGRGAQTSGGNGYSCWPHKERCGRKRSRGGW